MYILYIYNPRMILLMHMTAPNQHHIRGSIASTIATKHPSTINSHTKGQLNFSVGCHSPPHSALWRTHIIINTRVCSWYFPLIVIIKFMNLPAQYMQGHTQTHTRRKYSFNCMAKTYACTSHASLRNISHQHHYYTI